MAKWALRHARASVCDRGVFSSLERRKEWDNDFNVHETLVLWWGLDLSSQVAFLIRSACSYEKVCICVEAVCTSSFLCLLTFISDLTYTCMTVCMTECGQSCFVSSPVLGGLFGVVVPCWNIGVDSFRGLRWKRAAKFLWLGAARRSRGQASPPAHPTNPFMFPNRRPRAAPHSYSSTNACVCLIPETWSQWPPSHEHSYLLLIYVMSFHYFHLKLSTSLFITFSVCCLSPSFCPFSGLCVLNYYFLILTLSRRNRPRVFMPHVFLCKHIGSLSSLFITLSSALYVT